MVCREVLSLAKGTKRGGICNGHDSGLMMIKFNCKFGLYDPEKNGEIKARLIFTTKEEVINASQTIIEMAKEHVIIQISIKYYHRYEDDVKILYTYGTNDVDYAEQEKRSHVVFTIDDLDILASKDEDKFLIDSSDAHFITEEYASTLSELTYSAEAPYGSLIIIAVP